MSMKSIAILTVAVLLAFNSMGSEETPRHHLNLSLFKGRMAVCRLAPTEKVPAWAFDDKSFSSATYTKDELSIICPESSVPKNIKQEKGWRLIKVAGPLDFALTGILASMAEPLAKAGVSIFAVSTLETDYLMVKEEKLELALKTLREAGHKIDNE